MKYATFAARLALIVVMIAGAGAASAQWIWTPQIGRFINIDRLPKETPELQVEYARSLLLQGDHKKAYRETAKFADFYGDSDFADENQFLRGEIRMAQGKYLDAAKEFQQVAANYPESDLYDQVIEKQYDIGDMYYDLGLKRQDKRWRPMRKKPFKRAIEVYGMVIENEPFTAKAAEAQYKIGLCHHTRQEYMEAAYEYRRVMEFYPASDWVDEANYGLAKCYYDSSLPPDYDQTPSQLAITAVDDFKIRFPADERNTELGELRNEMRERIAQQRLNTARFYEKRQKYEAARISYEVVVEQFPETSAAGDALKWLEAHKNGKAASEAS